MKRRRRNHSWNDAQLEMSRARMAIRRGKGRGQFLAFHEGKMRTISMDSMVREDQRAEALGLAEQLKSMRMAAPVRNPSRKRRRNRPIREMGRKVKFKLGHRWHQGWILPGSKPERATIRGARRFRKLMGHTHVAEYPPGDYWPVYTDTLGFRPVHVSWFARKCSPRRLPRQTDAARDRACRLPKRKAEKAAEYLRARSRARSADRRSQRRRNSANARWAVQYRMPLAARHGGGTDRGTRYFNDDRKLRTWLQRVRRQGGSVQRARWLGQDLPPGAMYRILRLRHSARPRDPAMHRTTRSNPNYRKPRTRRPNPQWQVRPLGGLAKWTRGPFSSVAAAKRWAKEADQDRGPWKVSRFSPTRGGPVETEYIGENCVIEPYRETR